MLVYTLMANEYLKLMLWIVCMHADSLRMLCRYSILLFLMRLLVHMIRFYLVSKQFHYSITIFASPVFLLFIGWYIKYHLFFLFVSHPTLFFCKILLLLQIVSLSLSLSLSHTQNNTHTWTYCYYIFTQLLVFSLF